MWNTIDSADAAISGRRARRRLLRSCLLVAVGAVALVFIYPESVAAADIVAEASGSDPITFAVNSLKTFLATIATVVVAASIGWKAVMAWSAGSVEAQRDAQRFALQSLVVYGLVMAFNFGLMQSAVEYLVSTMGGRA